jgi:hypothetical protein
MSTETQPAGFEITVSHGPHGDRFKVRIDESAPMILKQRFQPSAPGLHDYASGGAANFKDALRQALHYVSPALAGEVFPEYYDLGRIIAAADERRLGTYRNKSDGLRFHVKRFDPDGTAHGTREFKHSDSDANWIVSARALTTRYEREPDPATAISLLMDLDDAVPRRRIVFLETQLKLAREEIRQLKHKPRCKFSSTCEHGHPDDIANHKNGETW